jgi:hypothetical protein
MTQTTTVTEALIDRYIAIWNETDGKARRELIARTWSENATYRDPLLSGDDRAGIDTMTAGFQAAYPDHTFERTDAAETSGNELRFGWALRNAAGEVQMTGSDIAVVDDNGLLQSITGSFDSPTPTEG